MTPPISFALARRKGHLHFGGSLLVFGASAPRRISRKASSGVIFLRSAGAPR